MIFKKLLLSVFLIILAVSSVMTSDVKAFPKGGNLIPNSSFELGTAGFAYRKRLNPEKNPKMLNEGIDIDKQIFVKGKQSLCVSNRFAELMKVTGCELKLKPNIKYTMSLWMKSDKDNFPVDIIWRSVKRPNGKTGVFSALGKQFKVNKEWKRYQYSFTVSDKGFEYYHLKFEKIGSGKLWLDGLQFDTGKLKEYVAKSNVEATFNSQKTLYTVGEADDINFTGTVVNNSNKEMTVKLSVKVINDYDGEIAFTKTLQEKLAANESKNMTFETALPRLGAYTIKTIVNGESTQDQYNALDGNFAVVGKYNTSDKRLDLKKTFCVGFNANDGSELERRNKDNTYYSLLSQAGCRLIRTWGGDAFSWAVVEPEQGKRDFSPADSVIKETEKYGMQVLPIFGGVFFGNALLGIPKWVKEKSQVKLNATPVFRAKKTKVYLPPVELWRSYIKAIADRYKGRITYYEVMNEPNIGGGDGYLSAAEYMEYLKPAYKVLKRVSKDNQVVGFCATGDQGGRLTKLLKGCFEMGGLNYADIVSFHPYGSALLCSRIPADKTNRGVKALLAKFAKGKKYPLWNTELYYLRDEGGYKGHIYEAHHAARRFLIDLGEGLGQSISTPADTVFKRTLLKHYEGGRCYNMTSYIPSSIFVTYNALARFFEGAKPVKRIDWPLASVCYVYKKDGKYLAAFWKTQQSQKAHLTLPLNDNDVILFDMFGNKLPFTNQPLELKEAPFYLKLGSGSLDGFIAGLQKATLHSDPVEVGMLKQIEQNVAVFLKNTTAQKAKGHVMLTFNDSQPLGNREFVLPPNSQDIVNIPVLGKKLPANINAKVNIGNKSWSTPEMKLYKGKISQATPGPKGGEITPIEIVWPNVDESSLKATMRCGYDDKNLYLTIDVKDKTPSGLMEDVQPWSQDCIELFIDPDLAAPFEFYNDSTARIFINPHAQNGKKLTVRQPQQLKDFTKQAIKRELKLNDIGYCLDLTIPLASLDLKTPLSGKRIGLDIAVTDVDEKGAIQGKRYWSSPDCQAHRKRTGFGIIVFK